MLDKGVNQKDLMKVHLVEENEVLKFARAFL